MLENGAYMIKGKDIDKLIKEADANMYENKKTLKENMKQAMD